jgi:succinate dehydrogenase / fumarate reductase, membrane anchor subunit
MKDKFRSELSKAKGLGSASSGSHHWWHQRLTALMLALMAAWLFCFTWSVADQELSGVLNVLQKPYNIIMLSLFILVSFYHASLGMQVVIEDYITCRALRLVLLLCIQLFSILTVISFLVAVLYIMNL